MNCVISVKVTPRSSRNKIAVDGESVCVWVMAAPTDGQANEAVCELLAKKLGRGKSAIQVISGHTSRHKKLSIEGLRLEEVLARLHG